MSKNLKRFKKRFRSQYIPSQEPVRCIFCGSNKLTKEHIFSRWTHKSLRTKNHANYNIHWVNTDLEKSKYLLIKKPGDIRHWTVECVCKPCNGGWMRKEIEETAKPIMQPLIKIGEFLNGETKRISPEEQKTIATWAALKAMVAEHDTHSWVTTHHTQHKYFRRNLEPPANNWAIWIGPYLRGDWLPAWASIPFLSLSDKQALRRRPNVRVTSYNSHVSTQVIGQLYIQVIRCNARRFVDRWRFSTPDKGSLFRIWPPTNTSIVWPGRFMTDRDADYVLGAIDNFLTDVMRPHLLAAAQSTPPQSK